MKTKLITTIMIVLFLASITASVVPVLAAGFDEFGYNYDAYLFNGWYGYYDRSIAGGWVSGTGDAWLVMKWSKNWIPMAEEPVGAWVTNHWTWYSNDYDVATWYGWDTRVVWTDKDVAPEATYLVTEFLKVQSVGDDSVAWEAYEAGGAYSAGWGSYASGVPRYVVFQDVISVYDTSTGELVATFNLCTASPKGLGQPIF